MFGLIGEKLSHSYSKQIHEGLGGYEYNLFPLAPSELESFIKNGRYRGLNVTIPYKKAVMEYCDNFSPTARAVGSVNTLVREEDGSLTGHNTDVLGFAAQAARAGVSFLNKKVIILGSGGTSHTALAVAAEGGARERVVVSRRGPVTYGDLNLHRDAEIIINTTPLGMYPQNTQSPLDLDPFPRCEGVLDVIYNPLRTRLVQQGMERGLRARGGLYMLVEQARAAAELFMRAPVPQSEGERIFLRLCADMQNIVLIGMPGSGKSSLGKLIAHMMGRPFFDVDGLIEKEAGVDIPSIFERFGEGHFRAIEAHCIEETSKKSGAVIATGGGAVLDPQNMLNLRQNSRVYFVKRDISQLATDGRPLSSDLAALGRMYEIRLPLYEACCHAEIENDACIERVAASIKEEFLKNASDS